MQQQQLADLSSSAQASAGACARFTSHLQLHLSTVTVLLAAAWAVLLHAAQCACAAISSGLANQTAAARSHLVLLRRSSPSRFYRTATKQALGPPPASSQHSAPAPSSTHLVRRHFSTQQQEGSAFRDAAGQQQHYAHVTDSKSTRRYVRVGFKRPCSCSRLGQLLCVLCHRVSYLTTPHCCRDPPHCLHAGPTAAEGQPVAYYYQQQQPASRSSCASTAAG